MYPINRTDMGKIDGLHGTEGLTFIAIGDKARLWLEKFFASVPVHDSVERIPKAQDRELSLEVQLMHLDDDGGCVVH